MNLSKTRKNLNVFKISLLSALFFIVLGQNISFNQFGKFVGNLELFPSLLAKEDKKAEKAAKKEAKAVEKASKNEAKAAEKASKNESKAAEKAAKEEAKAQKKADKELEKLIKKAEKDRAKETSIRATVTTSMAP